MAWWKCEVNYRSVSSVGLDQWQMHEGVTVLSEMRAEGESRDAARAKALKQWFHGDPPRYFVRCSIVKCEAKDCAAQAQRKTKDGYLCQRHFERRNGTRIELTRLELVGAFAEAGLEIKAADTVWDKLKEVYVG